MALEVENLNFGYLGEELLKNVSFRLLPNDHLGLVGLNGSGKSTLLNLLVYRLIPDSGKITWEKSITFSYLDQHLEVKNTLTIAQYLYNMYTHLFDKEEEMNKLYDSLAVLTPDKFDSIISKAERIMEYLEENEFYMIKSKIYNVINGLGIESDVSRELITLSSGQRGKIFLGKMLLEEKDVLLLDEPTNYLDLVHVEWLTKFLNSYKHPFIVISHNKEFLNNISSSILAIENKTVNKYKGNYDKYLQTREEKSSQHEKAYKKQKIYIEKTEDFIKKNITRASTTKRAQSKEKELAKVIRLEKPVKDKVYKFLFPFTHSFNIEALIVKNLEIGYDKPLLAPLNFSIKYGEKVVIIGANGVGKTTFVKTILKEIPFLSGTFKLQPYNDVLYFKQEYTQSQEKTAVEFFLEDYPTMENNKIFSTLGRYGITRDIAIKPFKELSGGELTKVRFAKLTLTHSNLLILDEPTNHLDRHAKDALFKALDDYPGTVILISHEKEFYRKLQMREIHFAKRKKYEQ